MTRKFEQNILGVHGDKGRQWLAGLPHIVEEHAAEWRLQNLTPVSNLTYNYVLTGFQDTKSVILKLAPGADILKQEADALQAFAGYGAVSVLGQADGALLLQCAMPGRSLKGCFPEKSGKATVIACAVMQKLHCAPLPPNKRFPHMNDWLGALDQDWDMPIHYLKKARMLKKQLSATISESVILHGDLHHDNVLADGDDWLVIDPKGVIGVPIHETWTFIDDAERDTQIISETFGYAAHHVRQWHFVHLVLAAIWNLQDRTSPKFFLDLAEKTYPVIAR